LAEPYLSPLPETATGSLVKTASESPPPYDTHPMKKMTGNQVNPVMHSFVIDLSRAEISKDGRRSETKTDAEASDHTETAESSKRAIRKRIP
jgi:hypothetical protein